MYFIWWMRPMFFAMVKNTTLIAVRTAGARVRAVLVLVLVWQWGMQEGKGSRLGVQGCVGMGGRGWFGSWAFAVVGVRAVRLHNDELICPLELL